MPSVVTYWQTTEDESDFLRLLRSTGGAVALSASWMNTKDELVPQDVEAFLDRYDPDQLLLAQDEDAFLQEIESREFHGDLRFGIPPMKACTIAYRRGKLRNGRLGQSNISAYLDYPTDDRLGLITKPDKFVRWVNNVIGWVRNATPERIECNGHAYRATKHVKAAVLEGKLEVSLY
jgi:hypothetical protein